MTIRPIHDEMIFDVEAPLSSLPSFSTPAYNFGVTPDNTFNVCLDSYKKGNKPVPAQCYVNSADRRFCTRQAMQ